jgi:hypothetical protein
MFVCQFAQNVNGRTLSSISFLRGAMKVKTSDAPVFVIIPMIQGVAAVALLMKFVGD